MLQNLPTNILNIDELLLRTETFIRARVETTAQGHGYLALCCGESLRLLYVGSEETNDAEWLFAQSLTSERTGWVAKENAVFMQILLSQKDIEKVNQLNQAKGNRPKALHNMARATLNEIAALEATQSAAHNLDEYLPWKAYVAQHKHAREIIGTGIIAATCEYIENEFDHNREYARRTDFMFYRTDGTCCRLHPGITPRQDAQPKIVFKSLR